ncbi:MAG TPA: hypothetical protein VN515_04555 [Terriglobales bacterium]|nr:hypothetical protein [Terriglobales bacterium]
MSRCGRSAPPWRGVGVMVLAGCATGCGFFQRRPPAPPPIVVLQAPILLPNPAQEPPMPAPAVLTPTTAPPPQLSARTIVGPPPHSAPRRTAENASRAPDRPAPPPVDTREPLPAGPQLTPRLSPAQEAADRRNISNSLDHTRRALTVLNARHNLTVEALATRNQIAEFVRQAQEALAQGDLVRAQTLALKADTLARFLLGS